MPTIDVAEAKRQFDQLLERVSQDQVVVITKNDRPLARLTAPTPTQQKLKREFRVEGEIWMSDDFDAPLDDFREYM
jgi:prevent-host-death family protein